MIIRPLKADLSKHLADLLVVWGFEGEKKVSGAIADVDKALGGIVRELITDEGFAGKERERLLVQTHGKIPAKRVLVLGLGKPATLTSAVVRMAAATAVKEAQQVRAKRLAFTLPAGALKRAGLSAERLGTVMTEGLLLGSYKFTTYHGAEAKKEQTARAVDDVVLLTTRAGEVKALTKGIAEGQLESAATVFARDLVNTPASDMTPKHLVGVARDIVKRVKGVRLEVFDEQQAKKLGMGAFIGVSKGSDEPSYFIHLSWTPAQKSRQPEARSQKRKLGGRKLKKVFLVGKGITFDSGGLSLKPSQYMERMHTDMAGAAAVLGVFSTLAELKLPLEIHGLIPATENMPSGKALKIHDVLRAINGKTIEVLNTDAEGRLVLSDALAFAMKHEADIIVDLATLTGACMVALGEDVAGLFSNNQQLTKQLTAAGDEAGEALWELPMPGHYAVLMKSNIADMKNTGDRWGGAIMGAMFLKNFVDEKTPWAHLDIAGPSDAHKDTFPHIPVGGTGFGVRTLIHWLKALR